jgi:poly-gamma-glutamate synthesis protein (capsule biosynthesis protein)
MDYGIVGLQDTFTNLKTHNLKYMGAGNNSDEAYRAVEVMIKGKMLKFLAFSRVLPDISWYPENQKPGIASAYQEELVIKTIEKENHDTDYLFVYIHWGTEKAIYPSEEQRKYAYNMIDAGADGVIGSHPHVLQGFEYYKEKPIAYSLGNFLFPDYVSGKSAETGILTLFIRKTDIQMNFSPYYIENNQIVSKDKLYVQKQLDYLSSISYMDHFNGKLIVNK